MHPPFLFFIFLFFTSSSRSQNFFPITGLSPPPPRGVVPHHAVLQAAADEAQLPPHLTNPHYKDARIRNALARHSWLGPGEQQVFEREAEKINRREIYTVLNHAGLVRTNRI